MSETGWIILITILLIMDTVISFIALLRTINNKRKILQNKMQIEINKNNISKLFTNEKG